MTTLSIGRAASCDIVVVDPTVSRRHAELVEVGPDLFAFTDRGSTSGSYRMVEGGWQPLTRAEVRGCDVLRLGDYETTLADLLARAAEPAAPAPNAPAPEKPAPATVIERDPDTGRIVVRSR